MSMAQTFSFAGASEDRISFGYPLGNGYRWYMPALMRFNAPDDFSPFGLGGGNAYAYCVGDAINHIDPTGHFADFDASVWVVLGIGVATVGIGTAALAYRHFRGDMRISLFREGDGASRPSSGEGIPPSVQRPGAVPGQPVREPNVSNRSFPSEGAAFPSPLQPAAAPMRNPALLYADDIQFHIDHASLSLSDAEATIADLRANNAAREALSTNLSDLRPEIFSKKQSGLAREEKALRLRGRRQLTAADESLNTVTNAINRQAESLVESGQVERLSKEYLRIQRLLETPTMLAFKL